jgi:hypothetical protein
MSDWPQISPARQASGSIDIVSLERFLEMIYISVEHHVNGANISLCGVVIDCDACRRYLRVNKNSNTFP